ncbi:MAG TPA: type II toxin-antitoxin system PemK/MazF family toxin [Pyrinomonadaceae bacterium]|nr:type II toxin-antitoxin system PemK/MazF family toxin [Pyrinomonadaceae bacterium]
MGRFIKGDVVTPFPFSDLTANKKRPALVVANLVGDDVIICLITSQAAQDSYAISITSDDFAAGKLKQNSNVRPNRLFTIDSRIVLYRVGTLEKDKIEEIAPKIICKS